MQPKKVIVFVGMPGAGKSVCVEYLKKKGSPFAYFGGITLDEIKKRGMEVSEATERLVREDIRAQKGKGAYAVRIIKQVEEFFEQGQNYVVVDGLYSWTEYRIFKESFGLNAVIIAVVAPNAVRHKRLTTRSVRPLTEVEANARDYAEIENLEKGGPIANADYFLANDSTVDQLEADLAKLLVKAGLNF
ncbi:dephospho-CoA kinase [Candidatus Saccharibacteria bacterium CG_4_10_14_0_2_um_filter_52_9]|nr:MAG: dephospho-CoA kinase [Candidatus Saccharibacteria bacterium CG_4_10_14_0_2_um_filter_52_9]